VDPVGGDASDASRLLQAVCPEPYARAAAPNRLTQRGCGYSPVLRDSQDALTDPGSNAVQLRRRSDSASSPKRSSSYAALLMAKRIVAPPLSAVRSLTRCTMIFPPTFPHVERNSYDHGPGNTRRGWVPPVVLTVRRWPQPRSTHEQLGFGATSSTPSGLRQQ
jgi:hypothetical protein